MNPKTALRVCLLLTLFGISVTAGAQLRASFSATPASGCSPLIVSFTDESTGSPNQWQWDLGNGTVSFLQHPSATYFTPGKYTIKLVIKNNEGEDSLTKTDYIEVFPQPVVDFSVSDTSGCYPLAVQFTDASTTATGNIVSWLWDFGDGATSTLQNPSNVYASARNFAVTLQVKNSNGCVSTYTKESYIKINTGVLAQFSNNNPQTCTAPVTVNFNDQSTGTGTLSYQWDFGDGNASTATNPSHIYTSNGSYTVKLIVTNSTGCSDTIVKPNAVTIGSVLAGFNTPGNTCQGVRAQFTNTSAPAPASVLWNFGDNTTSTLLSPGHIYANAGTFSVKMVANFGACKDSITKTVTILPSPVTAFFASDTTNCKTPLATNFTGQAGNAASYLWNFGDGGTSTQASPSHTYTAFGNYNVKLIVTGINGCTDSLSKSNYIVVKKPKATITNLPDSGCMPLTKTFNLTVTSIDPVTSYLWNFGDGNTSTDASPTHIYSSEGAYDVSVIILTANGCTDTAKIRRGIVTNGKPTINFSANPRNTCAKTSVVFSDLSSTGVNKWLWDFGDSTFSTTKNPTHLYLDTGYFDIKLKAWKGGCADSLLVPMYIHISPPIAKFTIKSTCANRYQRVFTDQSVGADEWHWDFGDGTTSTEQNPAHSYNATGQYGVTLRVINHASGCDHSATIQIRITDVSPQFSTADTSVCKNVNIRFNTGLNTAAINSYNWSFGDGTASVSAPASPNYIQHIFRRTGTFTIRLIVKDVNGCSDTLTRPNYIFVSGPTAKFTSVAGSACLNNIVTFNDSSSAYPGYPIQQWKWSYGDSNSETLTAPPFQHTYAAQGSYTVTLKITDSKGCTDSIAAARPLLVSKPKAGFASPDTSSCPGKQVHFADRSAGTTLNYRWDFGDGATATVQNPLHAYSSDGVYAVRLVITDQYGCSDSIIKQSYITVTSPVSMFTMSDSVGNCPPLIINFTNQSINEVSKKWDFGDSTYSVENNPTHFYNYPGTYFAKLTITGKGGCTAVYKRKVVVKGPEGHFTYVPLNGCNPVTVNFIATTNGRNSFVWDFNDGTTISSYDSVIAHTYTYTGKYLPKMILIDPAGCAVPIKGTDTIVVSDIKTGFNFTNQLLCDSGTVMFRDASAAVNDITTAYQWDFGDGHTSAQQNPVHSYTATGVYYPRLIATTQRGCKDTLQSPAPVKIVTSPHISITSTANGCTPLTATFNSQVTVADTAVLTWRWDFANGNTSTTAAPPAQDYRTAGAYTVTVIATNGSGCKDTASKIIEAYAIPGVSAGNDFILCKGSSKTMQATGAATYVWAPAIALSCANCADPATSTSSNISYIVTGTSEHGCVAKDTVAVTVKEKLNITHSNNDSICRGQSTKLSAKGADSYSWTPTNGLDNPVSDEPVATPDTSTTYRVVGADNVGCFTDTAYIAVKVNPLPSVEAGADKTINVGHSVDLVPVISPDVIQVYWSPTTGVFRNEYPGITVKPTENTEYTVDVKNRGGCAARDKVTVFVICNGSNIFIPNTFSPNGDGTNDVFYPRGTGVFKIKALRIYTRWGELIFDKNNFDANNPSYGWDGTNKGVQLTPDVFVYTLEVLCDNGSVLTHKGNIALIR